MINSGDSTDSAVAGQQREAALIFRKSQQEEQILSYPALFQAARRVAAGLRQRGVQQGDRLLILLPTSEEYVIVLCAAIALGAVPCTMALPLAHTQALPYLLAVLQKLDPRLVIAPESFQAFLQTHQLDTHRVTIVEELSAAPAIRIDEFPFVPESQPHHIQLTSGSTSSPKGVVLSHQAVMAHLHGLVQALDYQPAQDRLLSWLPLYHDMGLVQLLGALYYQSTLILMTPYSFLRNPLSWLRYISIYQATISAAPTFGYNLCVNKFDAAKLSGVDLSCWRRAFIGAEPVPVQSVTNFQHCYQPYGLSATTIYPCYGMAETVLATTLPRPAETPNRRYGFVSCDRVDAHALQCDAKAIPLPQGKQDAVEAIEVLGMGEAFSGLEVSIRNADGQPLAERCVGEICVRGTSLMSGYLNDSAATMAAIKEGWYYTGDRGYLADGELYVIGRIKELIIVRGRNYHPQDIEAVIERLEQVQAGHSLVFGLYNTEQGTDDVIVMVETKISQDERPALCQTIQSSLQQIFGFTTRQIILVQPGLIPRTTSGKRQRLLARTQYEAGDFSQFYV